MKKQQTIGIIIAVVSFLVLGLLFTLKTNTDTQMQQACQESCGEAEGASCSLDSCPYRQENNSSWIIGLVSVFTAFLAGIGVYLSLPQKKVETIVEEKEYDLTALDDTEKKIFYYVKEHPQGVYQSAISTEFNLSKVQTTRVLDTIEATGLIERKRRGMTNIVILK